MFDSVELEHNLEVWGGGCESPRLLGRTSRGVRGHAPQENFEKYGLFNAISCVLKWVFIYDFYAWSKIAGFLSKIGRLINISDYTGGAATPPSSPLSTLMCLNVLCVVFCALSHDASHFCNR